MPSKASTCDLGTGPASHIDDFVNPQYYHRCALQAKHDSSRSQFASSPCPKHGYMDTWRSGYRYYGAICSTGFAKGYVYQSWSANEATCGADEVMNVD